MLTIKFCPILSVWCSRDDPCLKIIPDILTVMASNQEDAPVEVPVVTEGMDGIIEGPNETNGEVNKKGILSSKMIVFHITS